MSDLIDRQAAIDCVCYDQEYTIECLEKLPSAQSEIVKCKKCRYVYYDKEFGNYWCDRMSGPFKVEADGYCKWGK